MTIEGFGDLSVDILADSGEELRAYRVTSLIRKRIPPRTIVGP